MGITYKDGYFLMAFEELKYTLALAAARNFECM